MKEREVLGEPYSRGDEVRAENRKGKVLTLELASNGTLCPLYWYTGVFMVVVFLRIGVQEHDWDFGFLTPRSYDLRVVAVGTVAQNILVSFYNEFVLKK